MSDPEQETWWRTTRALAVAAIGGAVLAGFLTFVLARVAGIDSLLGLPFDYVLPAAILPLVLLAIVFWHARRQAGVDRQYNMGED